MGAKLVKGQACFGLKSQQKKDEQKKRQLPQGVLLPSGSNSYTSASTIDYKRIQAKYKFSDDRVLGAGNFGKVFLAQSTADSEFKVAIKTIQKKRLLDKIEVLKDEINILSSLDHPNIVKYYETYESPNYLYLVMEYCHGGELFKKLTENGEDFTEQKAARIMKSLFLAVNHLHSKGIAHRDLKPENVMYGSDERVKIIDFGLSKLTVQNNGGLNGNLKTLVGTPYYVAPEVLEGDYSKECDCWSLGVIMYIILSGYLPFQGQNRAEVYSAVKQGSFTFEHAQFDAVHSSAKDLITRLLTVDKTKRLTCAKALQHPWFKVVLEAQNSVERPLDPQALQALSEYKGTSQLKMEALNVLVKMLDETQITHLQETFQNIDTDSTGMISFSELSYAFEKNATSKMSTQRIQSIMQNVDYHGNGKINYSEFLAATVSVRSVLTEEKLYALFKHFDTDNSDFITPDNIREAFHQNGRELSEVQTRKILQDHDVMGDGRLSFGEFKAIFFEIDDIQEMQGQKTSTQSAVVEVHPPPNRQNSPQMTSGPSIRQLKSLTTTQSAVSSAYSTQLQAI